MNYYEPEAKNQNSMMSISVHAFKAQQTERKMFEELLEYNIKQYEKLLRDITEGKEFMVGSERYKALKATK